MSTQKTVGLGRLRRPKGVKQVAFDDLKETIDDMIRSGEAKAHDYSDDGVEFSFVDD